MEQVQLKGLTNISEKERFLVESKLGIPIKFLPYALPMMKMLAGTRNIGEIVSKKLGMGSDRQARVRFAYRGREITLEGNQALTLALEIFFNEAYGDLDVKGKDVVDIGGCIGDTAVYFLLNGAKHVYAVEPYPATFRCMEQNLAKNGMDEKTTMLMAGIGDKSSKIVLADKAVAHPGNQIISSTKEGMEIPVFSLADLVQKLGVEDAAMKMDCEGAEYGALLAADPKTLQRFSQIIIEYHHGYKDIAAHLEKAGFKVKVMGAPHRPVLIDESNASYVAGTLLATRA